MIQALPFIAATLFAFWVFASFTDFVAQLFERARDDS